MAGIIFHPDVFSEVQAAYEWYENQAYGLGDDFIRELEAAFQSVSELPETWPRFKADYRRFLLSKFPYSVIYRGNKDTIFIVAVMHNSRKPGYWKARK
jgi:plasmid stabilization system protein ParE